MRARLAPMAGQGYSPGKGGPGMLEHAISALNAWFGDYLSRTDNELQQPMAFYRDNQPVAPEDIVAPPTGCRFAPRCRYAQHRCTTELPELESDGNHHYACFFPVGTDASAEALKTNIDKGATTVGLPISSEGRLG